MVKDTLNSNSSMFSNMNDPFEFLRSRLRKYQGSSVSPQSDTQFDEEEAPSREPMLMHDQLRLYTILSAKTMEVKRGMEIKRRITSLRVSSRYSNNRVFGFDVLNHCP